MTTEPRTARILIAEDEEALAQGLLLNLERKGYVVELAEDGAQALEAVRRGRFDLIVLDVRMPEVDGFEVCRRLRDQGNLTPILMLTARSQPDDVVYGLKLGADDYVVKPFDLAELLARVEGLLRRRAWGNGERHEERERYEFGDYWIDFGSYTAKTKNGVVELSQKEMAVMKVFLEHPNQVIARRDLLAEVWELPHHPNTRVVDNVIVSLRKAFEESSFRPRHIQSVRGVGYRFVP